jgi:hypothetical protein
MTRNIWFLTLLVTSAAIGQEPSEAPRAVDITKRRVVERPTEELLAELAEQADRAPAPVEEVKPVPADRTKRVVIEPAVEAIVRGTQPPAAAPADEPAAGAAEDNPFVEPGKVKWHDDVAAAMAAAQKSGKPVLVFHLLGELDHRFT